MFFFVVISKLKKIVGNRLFTGSFDGSLRIWDASELFAEKAGKGGKEEKPNKVDNPMGDSPQQMTIENETSFYNNNNSNKENYDPNYNSRRVEVMEKN